MLIYSIQNELKPNFKVSVYADRNQIAKLLNPAQFQDSIYYEEIYADGFKHAMFLTLLFCSTHKIDPLEISIKAL